MPAKADRAEAPREQGWGRSRGAVFGIGMVALFFAAAPGPRAAEPFDLLHPEQGEAWSKFAQTPADMALLTRIDAEVERLAALWAGSDIRFALMEDGAVRPVAKDADWPEGLVEAIMLYREDGRTRVVVREPQSGSGDWALTYMQYFDAEGRTIRFERAYSRIDPFCGDTPAPGGVAREAALNSFAPGLRLIDRRYAVTDGDGAPLTGKCDLDFREPYAVDAGWEAVRARLKLPAEN